MHDSTNDTIKHICTVRLFLLEIILKLEARGLLHDESKLTEPEKSGYDRLVTRLADVTYGSPEYRVALDEARPVIEHHYAHNRHRPEHHKRGIAGMTLIDLVEMLADWKAASGRTKQGSIAQSLEHNKQRFGIDDQLFSILENTVKELGW
jgi:hypothetical protein